MKTTTKQGIIFFSIIAIFLLTISAIEVTAKPGGKGNPPNDPPLSYLPNYTALIDGEGLYNASNSRPASYDAIAPAVTGPAKVNVIGASTAQLFFNAVEEIDNSATQWGDCAYGGRTADVWANPNNRIWRSCDRDGHSDPDVVIIKTGDETASSVEEHAAILQSVADNAFDRWPTLKQVYFVDEGWLGYYQGSEPQGYLHGQSIKQVVLDSIEEGTRFVSWGAYLWANGMGPDEAEGGEPGRNDGLEWLPSDYDDGLHQSEQGANKQATLFLDALLNDPVASLWYQ